jgi:hypothetical protein
MGHLGRDVYRWMQLYGGLMPSEVKKRRERATSQSGRRSDARQGDASGGSPPQTMMPARGCEMIDFVRGAFSVSIRKACRTEAMIAKERTGFSRTRSIWAER